MTHPNFVTNGASLEDCHTNFFALAELCGLKWRRYFAGSVMCYNPLDDPVLSSFSKCLAAGILCVWRRVALQAHELHRHNLQDCHQLNYKKELWIFWYGKEEPDLTGLVSPELSADPIQGPWDSSGSGLSYECRTLLFKALHNLIERSLLQKGFSRLGKWFVQPSDGRDQDAQSSQLTFSFNFFVHGDINVCASIDVRQRPPIRWLAEHHLTLAQGTQAGLKVVLSPFGLAGTLTGQSYKGTDLTTQRLLNDWHQFYPLRSMYSKDYHQDSDIPPVVEVIVSGVKMRYPSAYVLVGESDEAAAAQDSSVAYPEGLASSGYPSQPKFPTLSSVLTPPTSPCEPSLTHPYNKYSHHLLVGNELFVDNGRGDRTSQTSCRIKQATWQDCSLHTPGSQTQGLGEANGESRGHWDFCDPAAIHECKCSRCKEKGKANQAVSKSVDSVNSIAKSTTAVTTATAVTTTSTCSPTASNSTTMTSVATQGPPPPPSAPRKSDKLEKTKVPHKFKGSVPFHKRTLYTDSMVDFQQAFNMSPVPGGTPVLSSCSVNFQFKGLNSSLRAATPIGLPQLHTSIVQPSSLGSPLLSTPSIDTSGSQLSTTEPAMPTLSPHLPKEEEVEPTLEPQDQSLIGASPATTQDSSANDAATAGKDKPSNEALPSPFQNNVPSVPESTNIKSEESPASQSWSVGPQEDVKPPMSAESVPTPVTQASVAAAPPLRGLKRPSLNVSSREDPRDELVMEGLLYDYSFLNASVWENIPGKKRRVRTLDTYVQDSCDTLGNGTYISDGDQGQMMLDDSLKSKDPYEYDEFDEESPSSASFRAKVDDEEKMKDPGLPPTPESQGPPVQISSGPLTPAQDAPKPPGQDDQQSVSSPLSPRNQASSFTSEKDLQVTEKDLENIFDTFTSDDSADDLTPSTPTSTKLGIPEESFPVKCKGSSGCSSGIYGVAELIRMFPTPPSLDNNTASSPSGPLCGSDLISGDGECQDGYADGSSSPYYEPVKDWSYVYKLPVHQKYIGSQRYAPLTSLPNSLYSPLSEEFTYKATWQVQTQVGITPLPVQHQTSNGQFGGPMDRLLAGPNSQYPMLPGNDLDRGVQSMYSVDHSSVPDQRGMTLSTYELQSPASNASSYLNKHLNSIDNSSTTLPMPEAHSLLVNIEISDSMLNIFKDHNFASCMLCVCNMNTKGADAGLYLPSNLIPSGNDEPQYKCTCGFSAVVNRHMSHRSGIFYEDEMDITGHHYEAYCHKKSLAAIESGSNKKLMSMEGSIGYEELTAQVDHVPPTVVDLIKVQCSQLYSSFSLFYKSQNLRRCSKAVIHHNALEMSDGCEVCFTALDIGKQAVDNMNNNRLDESLKSSCLHKWPYLSAKAPASNLEVVRLLRCLEPILQEAIRQRRQVWEATNPVKGPLTWRQFHRLAGRGTEDQCEPQPIPSVLVGYDKDWVALSPFALKFWDKLLLEPYTQAHDIAYIVVAPDSESVLGPVRTFFKELSTIYELYRLGRHCPITKVLRDGIMRVGKSTAKNLADEPIDEWFNLLGDGPIATRLKLYAQACRYHLAPHLAQQTLDSSLLDPVVVKPPEKIIPVASPKLPTSTFSENAEKDQFSSTKPGETETSSDAPASEATSSQSTSSQELADLEDNQQIPTLVIYIVEPFTYGSADADVYRLATLGLLRSYLQMIQHLPEHIRNAVQLQVIALDSILALGQTEDQEKRHNHLKNLAITVFSRCQQVVLHQSVAKSLTGFGPAAAQDIFLLKTKNAQNLMVSTLMSKPFALAPMKDKQTELGETFGDRRERSGILYCTYCLTEDQRWLIASCTNEKGDIMETCSISTEIPNRTRRKKATVRKFALHKLLDFIVEVMSKSLHTWRLIVGRLGRLGHFELRDWATLLSRKSLVRYSRQLRQLCHQCSVLNPPDSPGILSACLVSLEPDSVLRVMGDQYTPTTSSNNSSSCNTCYLSTPQDASVTHILVFPTSATAQSSQLTFQQEHIDPLAGTLGDDDIFQALNDDDITVGQDINDIFRWTESPTHSPGASPRRDSLSQPGSPGCGLGDRNSPFHHGVPNRMSGNLVMMDAVEEPLQLLQQPLALGYYISTAKTGVLPRWFWSTCPHLRNICPVFLKSALLIHSSLQQNSDDLLHVNPQTRNCHPLDSNLTTDVLRYVLEGYNTMSWLALDPMTHDRRSCLPVHIQVLMQLYQAVEALM